VDFQEIESLDWTALREATEAIRAAAAEKQVWVLLGSAHRLSAGHLPHNSVYVISDSGQIVERYDKRFCTGVLTPEPEKDLRYYTPGNHCAVFEVDGFRCGVLICYDYRFPELYRELKRRGVQVLFQSFHNARMDRETFLNGNIWQEIVPATVMAHAATNHIWISATNSTAEYSMWGSFFTRPDGRITGRLEAHTPGVLISEVNPSTEIWDAPGPWRERAMNGQLHSGALVEDPMSVDRTSY
jgi:predicted amidohydrolase